MNRCSKNNAFLIGIKDGIPIGLGYFAVAFSLGIAARNAGITPLQGFIISLLNNASAGEYAAFTIIKSDAAYIQMFFVILIANARYFLMGTALSQRLSPDMKFHHRLILGYDLTDELFGLAINQVGFLNPFYIYGAMIVSIPLWATGTMLGILAGNILPAIIVSALSVTLYGMFLAIIIPSSKKDKKLIGIIITCFVLSYLFRIIPVLCELSQGTTLIILTILISALASIFFPIKEKEEANET